MQKLKWVMQTTQQMCPVHIKLILMWVLNETEPQKLLISTQPHIFHQPQHPHTFTFSSWAVHPALYSDKCRIYIYVRIKSTVAQILIHLHSFTFILYVLMLFSIYTIICIYTYCYDMIIHIIHYYTLLISYILLFYINFIQTLIGILITYNTY